MLIMERVSVAICIRNQFDIASNSQHDSQGNVAGGYCVNFQLMLLLSGQAMGVEFPPVFQAIMSSSLSAKNGSTMELWPE